MPYGTFFFGRYTRDEILRQVTPETMLVLPVGSTEQHGSHLALFADTILPHVVLERMCARLDPAYPLWILPPIPYGHSIEHGIHTATISLGALTLGAVIGDIGDSVANIGVRRLVLVNGHGGNVGILQTIAREIRVRTGLMVFIINVGALAPRGLFGAEEAEWGIHAGAYETSAIMAAAPDYVRIDRRGSNLPTFDPPLRHLRINGAFRFAWTTEDLSLEGFVGDATKASEEIGAEILDKMVVTMREVLEEIRKFRFPTESIEADGNHYREGGI